MSKELECLDRIDKRNYLTEREHKEFLGVVEKAIKEYETIKNAEPSKALKDVEELKELVEMNKKMKYKNIFTFNLDIIKQALLKAQEQEKAIAQFKEIVSLDYLCRVFGYPLGKQIKEYFMSNELLRQVIERVEE